MKEAQKILNEVTQEFESNQKLSDLSLSKLKQLILGNNSYSAISTAADCNAVSLAPAIAKSLKSEKIMDRWIAISVLLGRFRLKEYAREGLHHAKYDSDRMVKGAAIAGLGEILSIIEEKSLSKDIAILQIDIFENEPDNEFIDYREDAYEGILAGMDISPLERPPANTKLNLDNDVDWNVVNSFKQKYLSIAK